jgi:hypothetical protein
MDYPASRKPEHILGFAKKMSSPAIAVVKTYEEALKVATESEEGIGFVAYHPDMVGEDLREEFQKSLLTQVFGQVARKNQHIAHFILLVGDRDVVADFNLADVSNGFVAKIENNVAPIVWKPDEVSSPNLLRFVKEENVALVTALGPHNFHKIGHTGRPLVIAAVDTKNQEQVDQLSAELKAYALTGPREIVQQYYFGWMDGKLWQKFLEQFDVSPESLPQIFVLDVPTKKYWQNSSYTTVTEFLKDVDNGKIQAKLSSSQKSNSFTGLIKKTEYMFFRYLPWSVVVLVAFCALIVIMIMPAAEDLRPPYSPASNVTQAPTMSLDDDEPRYSDKDEEPKKEK